MDIFFPVFGQAKIYLFSPSIGEICIKNNEALKYISLDNEAYLMYNIVYDREDDSFVKYNLESLVTLGNKKIKL